MKIAIYKELSDSCEYVEVIPGKTILETFPKMDFSSKVIVVNGKYESQKHVIKETDLIVIRSIPKGSLIVAEAIIVGILTVAAVAGAIYVGIQNQKMQEELEKLQNQTSSSCLSDSVVNNPTLAGASNSIATGKTQPYIIGRNLYTPLIMNKGNGKGTGQFRGYHTIEGNKGLTQFYNTVLECGFNNQYIESLQADDITIRQFNNVAAQDGIFPINGNSIFATERSFVEIKQNGNDFSSEEFKTRIIENLTNEELSKAYKEDYQDLFFTLEKNSQAANIAINFPQGLRSYRSNGDKTDRTVTINPSYSLDYAELVAQGDADPAAHAHWTQFYFKTVTNSLEKKHKVSATYELNDVAWAFFSSFKLESAKEKDIYRFINKHKNEWILTSGNDIKNTDFQYAKYSYENIGKDHYNFVFTIYHETTDISEDTTLSNEITDNTTQQICYNAHCDFEYKDVKNLKYPITLRLQDNSTDPDTISSISQAMDTVQVCWVQSILYDVDKSAAANAFVKDAIIDEKERKLSTLIGVHLEATVANESKLGKINIITNGYARAWNGINWNSKKVTSNVAAWVMEILTSETHKPSQLDDSEIDLEAFAEWYNDCEENTWTVNMVLNDGVSKQSLIEDLCKLGHASLYNNIYGQISVAVDKPKENAVALLNSQNIISLETKRSLARRVDGINITYTDASAGYVENTILVMKEGKIRNENSVITSQTVKGLTSYDDIIRYARREMAIEELRPDVITVTVGQEGIFYTPLSKLLIQHQSLAIGLGNAEIESLIYNEGKTQIIGLSLYNAIEYDAENENGYGIICQCISDTYCTPIAIEYTAAKNGSVKEINFVTPIPTTAAVIPHAHDVISYGYLDKGNFNKITSEFLITEISKQEDCVKLTLVDYNEAIYDSGTIPEYTPNITLPKEPLNSVPMPESKLVEQMQEMKKETIALAIPTEIIQYWAAWNSNSTAPTEYSTDPTSEIATMTQTLRYLWNYSVFKYADGSVVQNGDPAVVGVYGEKGESGSGYRIDLSPEQLTMLDTTISSAGATFQIKASFFYGSTDLHEETTFVAKVNNTIVGTWENTSDGKIVTIPCSILSQSQEITSITIQATKGDVVRTAIATVTKIYSGQDVTLYKMLFSATNIKEDAYGKKQPEEIKIQKRKVNSIGESDTQQGYITASIDGGEEKKIDAFLNQENSDYNSAATYFEVVEPFFLYTDENRIFVLGNGINPNRNSVVGGVFYN